MFTKLIIGLKMSYINRDTSHTTVYMLLTLNSQKIVGWNFTKLIISLKMN